MNASPSNEEIMQAIKASGYLMEQEVAIQLESLGFDVSTNWAYEDIEEGKSREMDIRASKTFSHEPNNQLSINIEIVAECKNNRNPFVFLGRDKNPRDLEQAPEELLFPFQKYGVLKSYSPDKYDYIDAFFHLGFDEIYYGFATDTKAVQFCRIDRKGKSWHANHDGLYNSIFYPIAKVVTDIKNDVALNSFYSIMKGKPRNFHFIIPMVITSGKIFYINSTDENLYPQPQKYVTFKREIKSDKLEGTFSVVFVRQDKLIDFIYECICPLVNKSQDLISSDREYLLRQNIRRLN